MDKKSVDQDNLVEIIKIYMLKHSTQNSFIKKRGLNNIVSPQKLSQQSSPIASQQLSPQLQRSNIKLKSSVLNQEFDEEKIEFIKKFLLKEIKTLKLSQYHLKINFDLLIPEFSYEYFKKQEIIIQNNEQFDSFYIILKGKVKLIKDNLEETVRNFTQFDTIGDINLTIDLKTEYKIICTEDVICLTVPKSIFLQCFKYNQHQQNEMVMFTNQNFFCGIQFYEILEMKSIKNSQLLQINKNQHLFYEGQINDQIFYLQKGELQITKNYSSQKKNHQENNDDSIHPFLIQENNNLKSVILKDIKPNNFFGYEDFFNNNQVYSFNVKGVDNQSSVISLQKKNFKKFLKNKPYSQRICKEITEIFFKDINNLYARKMNNIFPKAGFQIVEESNKKKMQQIKRFKNNNNNEDIGKYKSLKPERIWNTIKYKKAYESIQQTEKYINAINQNQKNNKDILTEKFHKSFIQQGKLKNLNYEEMKIIQNRFNNLEVVGCLEENLVEDAFLQQKKYLNSSQFDTQANQSQKSLNLNLNQISFTDIKNIQGNQKSVSSRNLNQSQQSYQFTNENTPNQAQFKQKDHNELFGVKQAKQINQSQIKQKMEMESSENLNFLKDPQQILQNYKDKNNQKIEKKRKNSLIQIETDLNNISNNFQTPRYSKQSFSAFQSPVNFQKSVQISPIKSSKQNTALPVISQNAQFFKKYKQQRTPSQSIALEQIHKISNVKKNISMSQRDIYKKNPVHDKIQKNIQFIEEQIQNEIKTDREQEIQDSLQISKSQQFNIQDKKLHQESYFKNKIPSEHSNYQIQPLKSVPGSSTKLFSNLQSPNRTKNSDFMQDRTIKINIKYPGLLIDNSNSNPLQSSINELDQNQNQSSQLIEKVQQLQMIKQKNEQKQIQKQDQNMQKANNILKHLIHNKKVKERPFASKVNQFKKMQSTDFGHSVPSFDGRSENSYIQDNQYENNNLLRLNEDFILTNTQLQQTQNQY